MHDRAQIKSSPDKDKGNRTQETHATHATFSLSTDICWSADSTLIPQTVTAFTTPRKCFAHSSCTGQGMDSRRWRHNEPTVSLADARAFKFTDNVASHKSGLGTYREPGRKSACIALHNFWRSREKKETTQLRWPSTDRRTCLVSTQTCTSKQMRHNSRA